MDGSFVLFYGAAADRARNNLCLPKSAARLVSFRRNLHQQICFGDSRPKEPFEGLAGSLIVEDCRSYQFSAPLLLLRVASIALATAGRFVARAISLLDQPLLV